jgi:hypothetical protein
VAEDVMREKHGDGEVDVGTPVEIDLVVVRR